jgi:hypothetical protein
VLAVRDAGPKKRLARLRVAGEGLSPGEAPTAAELAAPPTGAKLDELADEVVDEVVDEAADEAAVTQERDEPDEDESEVGSHGADPVRM